MEGNNYICVVWDLEEIEIYLKGWEEIIYVIIFIGGMFGCYNLVWSIVNFLFLYGELIIDFILLEILVEYIDEI